MTGTDPEPARALLGGVTAAALTPISDEHARAFACRFTADFLSWDEDAPQVRYHVLRAYFTDPAAAVLGWSGRGRRHVDLVIPGPVIRSPQQAVVEVTARVVLYERTGEPSRADATRDELGTAPAGLRWATAPAPDSGAWRATATAWTTLHVPVGRAGDGALTVQPRSIARPARPGAGPT